jgi:hypothetical protein
VTGLPVIDQIARMKELDVDEAEESIRTLMDRIRFGFEELGIA